MPPIFSKEIEEKIITTDGLVSQPRTSPCEVHCPAGNPIQKVQALIQENAQLKEEPAGHAAATTAEDEFEDDTAKMLAELPHNQKADAQI